MKSEKMRSAPKIIFSCRATTAPKCDVHMAFLRFFPLLFRGFVKGFTPALGRCCEGAVGFRV